MVGRLAAGVAHDFKNLLSIVMGNAGLIARRSDLPEDVTQRARHIVDAADRGSALVHELLDFGREPNGNPRVLAVADVVEAFVPLLKSAVSSNYEVQFTREPGCSKVLIDRSSLERAILNLAMNAWDAMPTGGVIRIHVGQEWTTDGDGPPSAYVRIDVRDTGIGIPAVFLERVFDPSYTTKTAGKGTGLGLAVVRRVVDRAGGFIRVESTVGEGTTFLLYLPRVTGV